MRRAARVPPILLALILCGGFEAGGAPGTAGEAAPDGKGRFSISLPAERIEDRGFDCTNAEIEIAIDFDSRTIHGRVIHRFRPTRTIDLLKLDLTDSLIVTSVRRGALDLPFTHEGRSLEISLSPPLPAYARRGGDHL